MWLLKHEETGEAFYLLNKQLTYSVGRVGSSLVLQDDTSISRAHAFLHLEGKTLKLEDAGSKYGTFINKGISAKDRIKQKEKITLNKGDRIQFGLLKNIWKVEHLHFKCLVSSVTEKEKEALTGILAKLGGQVTSKWDDDCTHLTMNDVTITVKLVQALIRQVPIVTSRFWVDTLAAASNGEKSLPVFQNYAPSSTAVLKEITDVDSIDLGKHIERQQLFKGKTFVFMNRGTLDAYASIVCGAGGSYKDLKSGVSKPFLAQKNVIVIEYTSLTQSQSSQVINSLTDYVVSQGLRTVHHSEIGLAVLLCSTEKYCNPCFKGFNKLEESAALLDCQQSPDMAQYLTSKSPSCEEQMTQAFVPDTQEQQKDQQKVQQEEDFVIPESFDAEFNEPMHTTQEFRPNLTSTEQQQTDAHNHSDKRKRNIDEMTKDLVSALVEDEALAGDNDLFGCSAPKRAHLEVPPKGDVEIPETLASQPMPRIINGFFHRASPQTKNTAARNPQIGEKRKRDHIGIVGSDGEDEENLFDFIGSDGDAVGMHSPSKAKKSKRDNSATSDDELFGFTGAKEPKKSTNNDAVLCENSNSSSSHQQVPEALKSELPKVVPKPRPTKISIDGWLSRKMQEIKVESDNDAADLKMIVVKKQSIDPESHAAKALAAEESRPNHAAFNGDRKNYKKFVKQQFAQPARAAA